MMPLLFKKTMLTLIVCLFLATCMFNALGQAPSDSFSTSSGTFIVFQKFDRAYYETLQYLKFADRLIAGYLNSSAIKNKYTCQIYVLNDIVKGDINVVAASDNINIYINKDFRKSNKKFIIVSEMIQAMLLAKAGFNPNNAGFSLPQWLISGIYGRLELRFFSHSILPVSYFPGLKALCQENKMPDFKTSMMTPLTPDRDGTAYQLYEELCRFTLLELKRLSSRSDNPIVDMIFLKSRKKYSDDEVFEYTIARTIVKDYDKERRKINKKYNPNLITTDRKLNEWFRKVAEKRLINVNSPLPTKFFRERFKQFRSFTYIHKVKGSKPVKIVSDIIRLSDIYDKYGMTLEFQEMIDNKLIQLSTLLYISQPLCVKHLKKLREILSQFEYTPDVIINRRLKSVLGEIDKTLEKQQNIEDYLRKLEYQTVAPGKLYRNELIESKRLDKNFCPAINNYLDQIEKSFLKD